MPQICQLASNHALRIDPRCRKLYQRTQAHPNGGWRETSSNKKTRKSIIALQFTTTQTKPRGCFRHEIHCKKQQHGVNNRTEKNNGTTAAILSISKYICKSTYVIAILCTIDKTFETNKFGQPRPRTYLTLHICRLRF